MSLETELNVIWMASIMSIIDLSLTYYILWYDKKINPVTPKFRELNPLAKFVMKKTALKPLGLLVNALLTQGIIWGFGLMLSSNDPLQAITFGNFISGAIMVAIWMHFTSIKMLHKLNKDRRTIREAIGK